MLSVLCLTIDDYEKLRTKEQHRFLEDLLAGLSREIDAHHPQTKQSCGETVVAVFADHHESARCALALRDHFRHANWGPVGVRQVVFPRVAG